MSTIAQQREQIAQLQNQVQSGELENKRLTAEITFLRQKEALTSSEAITAQTTAHAESKKSPRVPPIPQEENKKGPTLRGDKKPVQEAAAKTNSPQEKKKAGPSASKKEELAPKIQKAGTNKNASPPEERKTGLKPKAQNTETSPQQEA